MEPTPRELEVVRLVAHGLTDKQIAQRLCIVDKTVAQHIRNLAVKLETKGRTMLAMKMLKLKLLSLEEIEL